MEEETMADLQATTVSEADTVLKEATVAAFKQSLRGPLITPGDDSYAEARQVWNGNIDRRPGLIARPVGMADVIQAVNFARDHNLLVSVRGGAHSFAGTCVCNGGLVIDLSLMKSIRVDPVRCVVRAEGGVYVNHIGREEEDGADQVRAAYGANYQRLMELKQKYDPTNLFRHNQNIKVTV
jgi:FAD/FMN-containing dehydrogenase